MKKILVLGSLGMAGHVVAKYLKSTGNYLIGEVGRRVSPANLVYSIDVTEIEALEHILIEFKPEVIINCIGVLNDVAETNPAKAIYLNSFLPHYLANWGTGNGSRVIHISTDCVFSGSRGNYLDTDRKDGEGFYAQSKALGEVGYDKHLTIRTSIIGPELKSNGIGLLHWFLTSEFKELKGYTHAFWSGVTTLQLAIAIERAIEGSLSGIIHLTNGHRISKYDLLNLFKEVFKKDVVISPYDNYRVDKSLALSSNTYLLGTVPSYEIMVYQLKVWIEDNLELYEYYLPQ